MSPVRLLITMGLLACLSACHFPYDEVYLIGEPTRYAAAIKTLINNHYDTVRGTGDLHDEDIGDIAGGPYQIKDGDEWFLGLTTEHVDSVKGESRCYLLIKPLANLDQPREWTKAFHIPCPSAGEIRARAKVSGVEGYQPISEAGKKKLLELSARKWMRQLELRLVRRTSPDAVAHGEPLREENESLSWRQALEFSFSEKLDSLTRFDSSAETREGFSEVHLPQGPRDILGLFEQSAADAGTRYLVWTRGGSQLLGKSEQLRLTHLSAFLFDSAPGGGSLIDRILKTDEPGVCYFGSSCPYRAQLKNSWTSSQSEYFVLQYSDGRPEQLELELALKDRKGTSEKLHYEIDPSQVSPPIGAPLLPRSR